MNIRFLTITLFLALFFQTNAKIEICNLQKSNYSNFYTVDVEQTLCLARNSEKDITIFFTYADWCGPCRRKLPGAIKLAEENNTDFYLLLVDRERDTHLFGRIAHMVDSVFHNKIKTVIISDSLYGERAMERFNRRSRRGFVLVSTGRTERDKYINFLTQITPSKFDNTNDMGKFIVLNKKGEVVLITNYEDSQGGRDDSKLFERVAQAIDAERKRAGVKE